tara:strand:- start:709 stop:873 length:165 start_codon:yes stop_codon:yes gene_type:complete
MNPSASKSQSEELDTIDGEARAALEIIKSNAGIISKGLAPLTDADLRVYRLISL